MRECTSVPAPGVPCVSGAAPAPSASGSADAAAVDRARGRCATYSAASVVIENSLGPAARRPRAARSASAPSSSTSAQRGGQRVDVAGLRRAARRRRRWRRCGSRRGRWRRPACRRPSPRSARRRTTRRAATGRRTPSAPRRRANFSASLIRPSHAMRSSSPCSARSAGACRGRRWRSTAGRRRAARANASSSTARPLRSSWRPQKKIVGSRRRRRRRSTRSRSISTPLNRMSYSPPRCAATSSRASLDTTTLRSMRSATQRSGPAEDPVARRAPGGVERADDRRRVHQHARHRRPGRQRLVDVEDVELLVVERPDRAQRGRGVGRQRGDRAVGRRRQAVAERRDERLRRRPVARPEHPGLVALAAQLAGQAEHLGLHAAGHGQAVGPDQPDPHPVDRHRWEFAVTATAESPGLVGGSPGGRSSSCAPRRDRRRGAACARGRTSPPAA